MTRFIIAAFTGILAVLSADACLASSLDELYRDIIRSDNRGYLPLFVKNRNLPDDLLLSQEDFADAPESTAPAQTESLSVHLSKNLPQRSVLVKAKQQQWLKAVAAIKSNQVTPVELNEVTTRVKENDPKAIEILAWMYTKGVGVAPNFVAAFNLYKKATAR